MRCAIILHRRFLTVAGNNNGAVVKKCYSVDAYHVGNQSCCRFFSKIPKTNRNFYSPFATGDKPINVTTDYVFKGIFNDSDRLRDFLLNLLIGDDKLLPNSTIIEDIQYINVEQRKYLPITDANNLLFDLGMKSNEGIYMMEIKMNPKSKKGNF